jgi:6-phosphofructokinase 1
MTEIRRIGVLTSGGDGPGLNPCIRAVTRTAIGKGLKVMGIERGYTGLLGGEFEPFDARSVGGILGKGGTVLGTTRLPEFVEIKYQRQAIRRKRVPPGCIGPAQDGLSDGGRARHDRQ